MLSYQQRGEVLYYVTRRGESPIDAFLNRLPRKARAKCISYIDMLEEFGQGLPRSFIAKVRGDLWELRPEWSGTEYRFFYFTLIRGKFVILHAVTKKTQRLKKKDIQLAESRMREIQVRSRDEKASPVRQRTD